MSQTQMAKYNHSDYRPMLNRKSKNLFLSQWKCVWSIYVSFEDMYNSITKYLTLKAFPILSHTPGHFPLPEISCQLASLGQFLFILKNNWANIPGPPQWDRLNIPPLGISLCLFHSLWVNLAIFKLYTNLFYYLVHSF